MVLPGCDMETVAKAFDVRFVRVLADGHDKDGRPIMDLEGFERDLRVLGEKGYEAKCSLIFGDTVGVVMQRMFVKTQEALKDVPTTSTLDHGDDLF